MLRVTVEIVPFGREKDKKTLGVMEIANCGTSYSETQRGKDPLPEERSVLGEYKVRSGSTQEHASECPWSQQTVRGHVRSYGFWRLIHRVLMEFNY